MGLILVIVKKGFLHNTGNTKKQYIEYSLKNYYIKHFHNFFIKLTNAFINKYTFSLNWAANKLDIIINQLI